MPRQRRRQNDSIDLLPLISFGGVEELCSSTPPKLICDARKASHPHDKVCAAAPLA